MQAVQTKMCFFLKEGSPHLRGYPREWHGMCPPPKITTTTIMPERRASLEWRRAQAQAGVQVYLEGRPGLQDHMETQVYTPNNPEPQSPIVQLERHPRTTWQVVRGSRWEARSTYPANLGYRNQFNWESTVEYSTVQYSSYRRSQVYLACTSGVHAQVGTQVYLSEQSSYRRSLVYLAGGSGVQVGGHFYPPSKPLLQRPVQLGAQNYLAGRSGWEPRSTCLEEVAPEGGA